LTLYDIINAAITTMSDTQGLNAQRLHSLSEMVDLANQAVEDLVDYLHLISDSNSVDICQISVVTGTNSYVWDQRILEFTTVNFIWTDSAGDHIKELEQKSVKNFEKNKNWRTDTGIPDRFCLDYTTGYMTFDLVPSIDGTIQMTIKRLPLEDMSPESMVGAILDWDNDFTIGNFSQEPEIRHNYCKYLYHYVLSKAYLKKDVETYDPVRAGAHSKFWEDGRDKIQESENKLRRGMYRTNYDINGIW
jgi:hypothetical protein